MRDDSRKLTIDGDSLTVGSLRKLLSIYPKNLKIDFSCTLMVNGIDEHMDKNSIYEFNSIAQNSLPDPTLSLKHCTIENSGGDGVETKEDENLWFEITCKGGLWEEHIKNSTS